PAVGFLRVYRDHVIARLVKNPQDAITELRRVRAGADHRNGLHFLENSSQILCWINFIMVHNRSCMESWRPGSRLQFVRPEGALERISIELGVTFNADIERAVA